MRVLLSSLQNFNHSNPPVRGPRSLSGSFSRGIYQTEFDWIHADSATDLVDQ